MNTKILPRLDAVSFLQAFVTQGFKLADQQGCSACQSKVNLIEYVGLTASSCLEEATRQQAGIDGTLSSDSYADLIVALKNQIGGNFSRASSAPGVVRVINTRCPFGDSVREAPELCRMTASVFGGIAARNFGYAKVELKQRIAVGHKMCEVAVYLDEARAAEVDGDEYRVEGDRIVSRSASLEAVVRVEKKLQQAWCNSAGKIAALGRSLPRIVAASPAMRKVVEAVELIGPTPATVLITGETGVGKEVIARALHVLSERANEEFLAVNCGAIPEALIETQLFGHEKGAFTGAYQVHHGFFERAEKGTLFLDEINSLPLSAQSRLLRVLETGEYERVGARHVLRANVRIIAASNLDPEVMVQAGQFRKDLFYRLNVVPIHISPLRERHEDISELIDDLLRRLSTKYATKPKVLSERAWVQVMAYDWPGNVRELENVLERSFLFARGLVIESVEVHGPGRAPETAGAENADARVLRDAKRRAGMDIENRILRDILTRYAGNVSATAKEMGITPRAVHLKLKVHGIDAQRYRKQEV